MHTNPFGCAAAFLSKAIKNLQPWELILYPGAIQQLAQRYDIPDLGDKIYELLVTTQLYKWRKEYGSNIERGLETFSSVGGTPHNPQEHTQTPQGDDNITTLPPTPQAPRDLNTPKNHKDVTPTSWLLALQALCNHNTPN